jgi:O-glycosyl hydrolase
MTRENKNDKTNEKKRRQSIPTALKRAALKHFEISKNKQETRKRFKVSRQQIQQWFKNKEAINDPVNLNRNRRINDRGKSLKRAKYHDIELQLNNFVLNQRQNNFCVTVRSIQNKMNELMKILEENTERLGIKF